MRSALMGLVVVALTLMLSDVILAQHKYDCDVSRYTPKVRIYDVPALIGGQDVAYLTTAACSTIPGLRSSFSRARLLSPSLWQITNTVYFMNNMCAVVFLEDLTFNYTTQRLESTPRQVGNTTVWIHMYFLAGNKTAGFFMYGQRFENGVPIPAKSAWSLSTRFRNVEVDPMIAKPVLDVICNEDVDVNLFFHKFNTDPTVDGNCIPR